MGPGDIVRLIPEMWTPEYAGRLAMVLGCDSDDDRLIILVDPVVPGVTLTCWPEELLPLDADLAPRSI